MGISILIVLTVMFLVFMKSLKDIDASAKTVYIVMGILLVGFILWKVIRG